MKDKELMEALFKKALGYDAYEETVEYRIDESGDDKAVKKKVTKKHYPPDIGALKTYLEVCGEADLSGFTDEQLEAEKERLLKEFFEAQRRGDGQE